MTVAAINKAILDIISEHDIIHPMNAKHARILDLIFFRPVSGNIRWQDVEALLIALGAEISEGEGSRVCVRLFGDRRVFHRPHPSPVTDKGAVESLRKWLEANGVRP